MNIKLSAKKAIFIAIFSLAITFPVAPAIHAQTFSAEQQATLDQINQTLITLLTQLIAQLQAQITELLAQQAQTQQAVTQVQDQVNTVVSNTAPVVGIVEPTPTPDPYVSVEFSCSSDKLVATVTAIGKYEQLIFNPKGLGIDGVNYYGGSNVYRKNSATETYNFPIVPGSYNYELFGFNERTSLGQPKNIIVANNGVISEDCQ